MPAKGHRFVIADYSQIELRIAAKIAGEDKMIEAFRREDDLHTLTAKMITGKDDITKDSPERQLAKAVNFGLLYGMGVDTLRTYAENYYGVKLSKSEAKKYRDRWRETYPKIAAWHQEQGEFLNVYGRESEKLSMRTLSNRVRHGVKRYSERLNTPVQGSGADGLKLALIRAAKAGLCPVLAVHDEIVCEVSASRAQEAKDKLERIMRNAMLEVLTHADYPHVPVEVEPEVKGAWFKYVPIQRYPWYS